MFGFQISLKSRISGSKMAEFEDDLGLDNFDQDITTEIADDALAEWEHLAKATLGDSAEGYIEAMRVEDDGEGSVNMMLDGALPNMQEKGSPAFDMKPGLLAGREYRVIPITHGKPGSGSNPMSKQAYSKVKNLNYGQRSTKDFGRAGKNKVTGYKHTEHKLSGIMKPSKSNSSKFGGDMVTFRAVSVNSPTTSWWHPGFKALDLIDKVKEHLQHEYGDIINKIKTKDF